MITTEIYIEGRRLDIISDHPALLTFVIDDVKDFASRNTNVSKTIVLPGTANNNSLFGFIFDAQVMNGYDPDSDNVGINFNAAKSAKCLIFHDHIQVFKGVLRLLKIVIENGVPEYECAVFGELGGLISSLGNKKLTDLDFSAYDRNWNASGITNTWPNYNAGSGLYFPLIDYGEVSTLKVDYDIRAFRPALFVKEYLDKIFTGAGYTYSSNLFLTSRFKSLLIPHNRKNLQKQTTLLIDATRTTSLTILTSAGTASDQISWETVATTIFTPTSSNRRFTYNGVDPVNITINWDMRGVRHSLVTDFKFVIQKNGVDISGAASNLSSNNNTYDIPFYWNGTVDVSLVQNDYIEFYMVALQSGSDTDYLVRVDLAEFQLNSSSPQWVDLAVGDVIKINDSIPKNILQKDFLASILRLFNLYVYEDQVKTKFINIKPYVDFYNTTGITDWNYRLDRVRPIELTPMSELNSRYYNFNFKPDSDYYNELYKKRYNEVYGSYIYDSAYEFANEKEDIDLIFSPTPLVGYSGADKIVSAMYKLTSAVEERMDTNIRILQAFNVTGVTSWAIKDGATVLQSGLTTYGYAGHYNDPDAPANDIHFGVPKELFFTLASGAVNVTQFNVYWSPYMAEITDKDSRLLSGYFKLSKKDINELDFSKYIYLNGSYWRLNKVMDWNAAKPDVCIAEILKVIYTTY